MPPACFFRVVSDKGSCKPMWRGVSSVSFKFLIFLLPTLIGITVVFLAAFFVIKGRELEVQAHERFEQLADINARALAASLWSFDTDSTRNILATLSVHAGVRCALATEQSTSKRFFWPESGCPALRLRDVSLERGIVLQDRRIGSLRIVYDGERIRDSLNDEMRRVMWLLLLLALGTAAAALVAHRLTIGAPLARLIDAIRQAERGEARLPVEWRSSDELGRMILAYNGLLERLTREEQALRKSERRLSLAIAATRSSVWDHDLLTDTFWCSPALPSMLGLPENQDITPQFLEERLHSADRERVRLVRQAAIIGGETVYGVLYRMQRGDHRWVWIEDKATLFRDASGEVIRLTGIMADVTERERAREALAHERAILQATLENLAQGVLMVDAELRLEVYNRRFGELLDISPDFLASRPTFAEIMTYQIRNGEFVDFGDDPYPHIAAWFVTTGDPYTYKRRRPNGTVLEVHTTPLPQGGLVQTFTDVTVETRSTEEMFVAMQATEKAYAELKATQASLVQAEKMASLATLVAGVAHEINTPVGIAYGCATHLDGRTRATHEAFSQGQLKRSELATYMELATESSRLILTNLQRAAALIQSFKQVAVDQTSATRRRFDLRQYLEEIITSLGPRLRSTPHTVHLQCPEGILLNSFPGAFSQVVTNLVINALTHAFPADEAGAVPAGTLTLSATLLPAATDAENSAGDVELHFADNGCGIPEDHRNLIFEPFFTTRRGSGGSGLGLHIVFNLVTQTLGGSISVASTPGAGTTFIIRLPLEPVARA